MSKHHYIPRCFLKGFCRPDGTFDVFDKHFGQFRKAPQSPGTVFFERNLNTIQLAGRRSEDIEALYSRIETALGELLDFIRSGKSSDEVLKPDGIYMLKVHMAMQFWRLPCFNQYALDILARLTVEEIEEISSKMPKTPSLAPWKIAQLLQEDPGFKHYFKCFWLPLGTANLERRLPDRIEWKIFDAPEAWSNLLCSDQPFLLAEPPAILRFDAPFVFPLSSSRLLISRIRKSDVRFEYEPLFSTLVATHSFCKARRYVAGANRDFLSKIFEFSAFYRDAISVSGLEEEILSYLA